MTKRYVTTADKARMIDLYNEGSSVRDVADETGFSPSTVSTHLRRAGVTNRRAHQTAEAIEANRRAANARRLDQVLESQDDAELLRSRLWEPIDVVVQGVNGAETIRLAEPPIKDQAAALRAITAARLADHKLLEAMEDQGNSAQAAASVLTSIFEGLGALFAQDPNAGLSPADQDHDYDIATDPDEQPGS